MQPQLWSRPLVEVAPLGKVPPMAADVAAAHLQGVFELPAKTGAPLPEPEYAFLPNRGQYDAGPILSALAACGDSIPMRLGVMSHDICLPFLTHVFGQAQLEGRAAVISLYRLRGRDQSEADGSPLVLERLAKVALHEIAHVMGLVHCQTPDCLMNFSAGLEHLDKLKMTLCPFCHEHLQRRRMQLFAQTGQDAETTPSRRSSRP